MADVPGAPSAHPGGGGAPTERLRRRQDFERVFGRGRSCTLPLVVVRYLYTGGRSRLAVAAGKRLGTAVRRNRLRRRWREVVRLGPPLACGFDIVVVARGGSEGARPSALRRAWLEAARRCGLLG